jgi:E3 ubiquitin-protein ligase synoviolin
MTIFRGEIGAWFLVMFFALLTGKVWGWIGEGRVEILEQQPPANPRLFHTRLAVSLALSVLFDTWMLEYVVKQVLEMARPDMMVMFGFEFAVLSVLSLSTMARYGISLVEILIVRGQKYRRAEEIRAERRDAREAEQRTAGDSGQQATPPHSSTGEQVAIATPTTAVAILEAPIDDSELEVDGWEEKGRWIFYLDLTTDFFKLVIYLSFFFILLVFYGLPIHIMRDVFLTCRSFFKRIGDFIRYRTATKDMNERYPDATVEDIGREDVCIICREEMRVMPRADASANAGDAAAPLQQRTPNPAAERMRPKKLPCGHVLHFSCLRSWLERQQICPTCRRPVVPTARIQVGVGAGDRAGAGLAQGFADGVNAARGQGGQNQAPHQHGPGQAQAQGNDQLAEPQNQNRARIFQLGPLRFAVGAGRGMMMEDIAQRIHDGEAGAQNPVVNAQNGPQQYGFGFGFSRSNRRASSRPTSLQGQIDSVERQIQREIDGLRLSAAELGVVRSLQGELTRLRALRQQQPDIAANPVSPGAGGGVEAAQPPPQLVTATGFVADTRQNVLEAGNEALPPGLTLPDGWTMMPLQRLQPGTQIPPIGTTFAQPGAFGFSGGSIQIPVPPGQIPDLMQAMQGLGPLGPLGPLGMQHPHQHAQQGQPNQSANGGHRHHHHHHLHANTANSGDPQVSEVMRRMQSTLRRQEQQLAQFAQEQRQRTEPQESHPQQQQQVNGDAGAGPDATHATQPYAPAPTTEADAREESERDKSVREFPQRRQRDGSDANGSASGSGLEAQRIEANANVNAPILPAWGSGGQAQPRDQVSTANGVNSGGRDSIAAMTNGGGEASTSTPRKPQPASVEDLVEGPD